MNKKLLCKAISKAGLGGRLRADSGALMFAEGSECDSLPLFGSCNLKDSIGMRNIENNSRIAVLSVLQDMYSQGHCLCVLFLCGMLWRGVNVAAELLLLERGKFVNVALS